MFWKRFETLCDLRGMKPNPVGKKIGISSGVITSWKKGTIPNGETLIKLSTFLECSIDYLLGLDDIPNRNNTLPTDNQEVLEVFNKLSERNKILAIGYMRGLIDADNKVCSGIRHDMTEMMPAKADFIQPSAIENIDTK